MNLKSNITKHINRTGRSMVSTREQVKDWLALWAKAKGQDTSDVDPKKSRLLGLMDFAQHDPILDPEHERWASYNGPIADRFGDAVGIDDPALLKDYSLDVLAVALAVRRATFKQRVLDGVALREAGQVGDRFLSGAEMADDKSHWRIGFRRLAAKELARLDPNLRDDVESMRLAVDYDRREIVLVTDQRLEGFYAMEALRAMVRCEGVPEHGYTVRVVVVVFMDEEESNPLFAYPYELMTLTHYAPERVVLVGGGSEASDQLEQAVHGGGATIAGLYERAMAFFAHWRPEDDPDGQQLQGWASLIKRALWEDALRDRESPVDALKDALSSLPRDESLKLAGDQLFELGSLLDRDGDSMFKRLSFKRSVFDPTWTR